MRKKIFFVRNLEKESEEIVQLLIAKASNKVCFKGKFKLPKECGILCNDRNTC